MIRGRNCKAEQMWKAAFFISDDVLFSGFGPLGQFSIFVLQFFGLKFWLRFGLDGVVCSGGQNQSFYF
jgi:hypothetical protein